VLVRAQENAARAVLTPDRYADIESHNWQFGGRPSEPRTPQIVLSARPG
jgi:uncharacterized protein